MSRLLLVHWNREEASAKARALRKFGHTTDVLSDTEKRDLKSVRETPPDLFVIDLNRLPAQGREVGGYLRRLKATR
jgi:DNA-binding response OmpR family regulator